MPRTLCVDFDGVLHSYTSGWQGADKVSDPPVRGAMTFLVSAVEAFDVVCIYSSRSKEPGGIPAMSVAILHWLQEDLGWSENRADEFVCTQLHWPDQKPAAFVTLDDRCVCFNGTFPPMADLLTFQPWNKRAGPVDHTGLMSVSEALRTDDEAAP